MHTQRAATWTIRTRAAGTRARLDLQQRPVHAQHCAVNVDELAAEAHKVGVVLVDHLHQALLERAQVRIQLRTQRVQRHLPPERKVCWLARCILLRAPAQRCTQSPASRQRAGPHRHRQQHAGTVIECAKDVTGTWCRCPRFVGRPDVWCVPNYSTTARRDHISGCLHQSIHVPLPHCFCAHTLLFLLQRLLGRYVPGTQ